MKDNNESQFPLSDSNYDYIDSYEYVVRDTENRIGIPEIAASFLKPGPKWFESLFTLRNKIASLFNLKTPATIQKEGENNDWKPGVQAGLFKVFDRTESEIILGEDDKHLDVRISLSLVPQGQYKKITVTTMVKIHNLLGRSYFFFVKPVHRMVVPILLKQKFKQLEQE